MIKDTIVFDCKNTINIKRKDCFVSENFKNDLVICWHIDLNSLPLISTNLIRKKKKRGLHSLRIFYTYKLPLIIQLF